LDIGSGFGKPNFHAALQIRLKESIGVEVVPARVSYCIDQKFNFESYYKQIDLNCNSSTSSNLNNASQTVDNQRLELLKIIGDQVQKLEGNIKLAELKGYAASMTRLKNDVMRE
jgi:hypothetical protein